MEKSARVVDIVKMSTLHTHFPQQRNSTLSNGVSAFELDLLMRRISSSDKHLNSTIFQLHIEQQQTFERDVFFISNTSILHQPLFVNVISQSLQKINPLFHQSDVSIHAAGTAGTACSNSQGFVCAFPKSAESFAVK